ncbi:hypothetical protein [Siansivirga zeaxanthinifaciens]|uniref:Lipoprotein n=1 Tax=Siansivirga zeaxanthinifaciens CC-SAMT-1 TaxID=1454006 RepID=A0A0C5W6Y0_9FLAO|nr:hypothetical protein [Siansivirga zeaxanthinifaciens]AJR02933.1 hypothetical protein AW14_04050 [Siansivirga zeaxanthinifaciens CC-SAMT-1]
MKKYLLLVMASILSVGCQSQSKKPDVALQQEQSQKIQQEPKGSWKVDKEFDENGNLIKYDSIYSWSSHNNDRIQQSFKSHIFKGFSGAEQDEFTRLFPQDSLFSNPFFKDDFFDSDFGSGFTDINDITQKLMERHKKFLEKFHNNTYKPQNETTRQF